MTMIIQVIDCHIKIQHNGVARIDVRKLIIERINAALSATTGYTSVLIVLVRMCNMTCRL